MISMEWNSVDAQGQEANASGNADAFHGDLFGDELMDIYHIVSDEGTDVDQVMIPNDLSIIQAVLDSTVGPPSGIKGSEDLGLLRSSMSFSDLLASSTDKVSPNDSMAADASSSIKRKLDDHLPGETSPSNKKSNGNKQDRRGISESAADQKRKALNTASVKVVAKEKNSPKGEMEDSDMFVDIISAHPIMTTSKDSVHALETARSSVNPVQGDTNANKPKLPNSASLSQTEGDKSTLQSKLTTASLPVRPTIYPPQPVTSAPLDVIVKAEDNFKGVAKAAVLNLIQNACNAKVTSGNTITEESDSEDSLHSFKKPVNTSTAHIHALTSANWMSACSANVPPSRSNMTDCSSVPSGSEETLDAKLARSRRASLSADERANLNRDRNREHARNTRLRKKAYVEELKKTLTDLVTQRDAAELEKRHEKQRDLEVREVRFRVMEEFLKLRSRGSEANLLARWIAILEDGFTLTLPRTEYRQMVGPKVVLPNQSSLLRSVADGATDGHSSVQVLKGAVECMDDALKLNHFVNSIGRISSGRSHNAVKCNFTCDKSNFMMDGVHAFLEWTFVTSGATQKGCPFELSITGYMRSTFSPASNKLLCATLHFDTGSVMAQLKLLNGFENGLGLSSPTVQFISNPSSDKGESDEESNAVATITLAEDT